VNDTMDIPTPDPGTPRGASRSRGARRGFTLPEVLLVLAIVGIIMSIAAPAFSPDRWRSDGALQTVAIAMNSAQRAAVLRQHDMVMTFDMDGDVILLHADQNNDGSVNGGEATKTLDMPETIGFANSGAPELSQGSGPISWDTSGSDPVLTFHRNGSASEEGAIYLSPVRGRKAAVAESARAITIERATGVVRCWSYRTSAWEEAC